MNVRNTTKDETFGLTPNPEMAKQADTKAASDRAIAEAGKHGGFLTPEWVAAIAAEESTRLRLVLIRCGNGRFTAPAQDAQHFIDIITREGSDYVRDVSLAVR